MNQDEHNKDINDRIIDLESKMDQVHEHIATTNFELGNVKANVEWLIWGFKWLLGGIGTIITGIIIELLKLFK